MHISWVFLFPCSFFSYSNGGQCENYATIIDLMKLQTANKINYIFRLDTIIYFFTISHFLRQNYKTNYNIITRLIEIFQIYNNAFLKIFHIHGVSFKYNCQIFFIIFSLYVLLFCYYMFYHIIHYFLLLCFLYVSIF